MIAVVRVGRGRRRGKMRKRERKERRLIRYVERSIILRMR